MTHEETRRKFWMDVYVAALSHRSKFTDVLSGEHTQAANKALMEFDKRFDYDDE